MLNVYFRMINSNTLKILKELRSLRHRSIKLWFNKNDCEDVPKYFMDKKCISSFHETAIRKHGRLQRQPPINAHESLTI